jgi:hypothetical protein
MNERFDNLVGKTIAAIRWMTDEEIDMFGWAGQDDAVIVFFSDGSWMVPSSDPEGNGPGFIETGGDDGER